MERPPENRWICDSEQTLLKSPVMEIVQRDCHSSEGDRKHRFYLLKSTDWCNIAPITEDGKLVLVRQYRIGISRHTLEVPGGLVDPTDPHVQAAALREMTEETGFVPLHGARCLDLGWCHPNPAILDNRCHFFAVGPVKRTQAQNLDPGEMIDVVEVPLEEVANLIIRGEITHALTLTTLFKLGLQFQEGLKAVALSLRSLASSV